MAQNGTHSDEALLQFAENSLSAAEKRAVDEHLKVCEDCRHQLSLIEDFKGNLGRLSEEEFTTNEPCPDSETLVAYEAGNLEEETSRHLRAHLLFCDECAKEYYALRRVSQETKWRALLEFLKEWLIDLTKSYGVGLLVGPVRVASEQIAFATRGGDAPGLISKVLEIAVGENSYSIEVAFTEEGMLSWDIAGVRTPVKEPLTVSVHAGTGAEVLSFSTNANGNGQFVIPGTELSEHLGQVVLRLKDQTEQFLIRIPEVSKTL
jgi:hypothetical protein